MPEDQVAADGRGASPSAPGGRRGRRDATCRTGRPTGPGPPEPKVVDGDAVVFATLDGAADSAAPTDTRASELRADLDAISTDILVGGNTAIQLDTRDTTGRATATR